MFSASTALSAIHSATYVCAHTHNTHTHVRMYVTPFAVIHDCVIPLTCTYVARQQRIDVVLVDTAGRMQDNEPLMRALAKVLYAHSKSMCHVLVILGRSLYVCVYVCVCVRSV